MKYITGQGENIRVIELPDDARIATPDDESVLATREQQRLAQEQAYRERVALSEARLEKESRIGELKRLLDKTDYQAIKFAEGEMSEAEYSAVKAERVAWRAEINELEAELCNMS